MRDESVLYAVSDGVASITLNRPRQRNALNGALCDGLLAAAQSAAADASVQLVLVRAAWTAGAAGPVFCAGADLKERQGMSAEQVRARRMKAFAAYESLESLPMPVIAVVEGAVIGSGCEIAAACDFIVATHEASFRTPEALAGTVGATQRLPRVLGKRLAKDLMFTGRRLSAAEAERAGLVARVVASAELEQALADIARIMVAAPQAALRLAKRSIDRGVELDPRGALETELAAIDEQLASGSWLGSK